MDRRSRSDSASPPRRRRPRRSTGSRRRRPGARATARSFTAADGSAMMPMRPGRSTTWQVIMGRDSSFASRLRWWRQRRGLSQVALAHVAEIAQRHVSLLESGRTAPSREMVLRLAAALDLPFREQNALLLAAGFAPAWREPPLGAPELALVDRALDCMLIQQEPYPAFVVDRRWQLLRTNPAGQALARLLTQRPAWKPAPGGPGHRSGAPGAPKAPRPPV